MLHRWVGAGLLIGVLAGALGCAPRSEVQRGHVVFGPEVSTFQPCGTDKSWWLTGEGDAMSLLRQTYDRVGPGASEGIYAEVRGVLSREGSYGHLGAYAREFYITGVQEARASGPGDCTASPGATP